MRIKKYQEINVLDASRDRISKTFDDFEVITLSFSGGKDSTLMFHLAADEARKRNRKITIMIIDLEAQYTDTIDHIKNMLDIYKDCIEVYWIAIPMLLRNAVSNYEPKWIAWDPERESEWVREKPEMAKTQEDFPFLHGPVEFEEFIVMFPEWYSKGRLTANLIGIRADESLHRYGAIANQKKGLMHKNYKWTTKTSNKAYNIYPIYDWRTSDLWVYHVNNPEKPYNPIYEKMYKAGVPLGDQRLCQPYGDDQKKGLWLYHILEPDTWYKLVNRVNGANSGALYIRESGNMTGRNTITKPEGHTWESFTNLLLATLPKPVRDNYTSRFKKFIAGWKDRGYKKIPDESPRELEAKQWAPSWRRMCKAILRNDYYCKSLGQTQPKSDAYKMYKEMKKGNLI